MDSIFGFDRVSAHDEGQELLMTVYNPAELAVVQSVLKDAEIPFLAKDRGSGGSMKIIAGYSVFGTDIFVLEEHLEVARALFESAEFVDDSVAEDSCDD